MSTEVAKKPEVTVTHFGKHWAVIQGDRVVSVYPMYVPGQMPKEDYTAFVEKMKDALSMLGGKVKAGEVIEEETEGRRQRYFIQRLNHQSRRKAHADRIEKPVVPPKFPIFSGRVED